MTLPDLTLADSDLEELTQALPGCDFSDDNRRQFLECVEDKDVQAAPGSGKTTLLVAKLDLMARRWGDRESGICVMSHTNAARREVEGRLQDRTAASVLLNHPHYIGTITGFIHRFLAMPYLRGLGWPVRWVDAEVCKSAAFKRHKDKAHIMARRRPNAHYDANMRVDSWIEGLAIAPNFQLPESFPPEKIEIVRIRHMPAEHQEAFAELQELKAELVAEGIYSFTDMNALAYKALEVVPELASILARRFPIVFVDEAQDTSREHLDLIDRVFKGRSVIQHLGDENQTIYEAEDGSLEGAWSPADDYIDLGESKRFGAGIAEFATKVTVRQDQKITGNGIAEGQHTLILFNEDTITRVLPTYAETVARECPDHEVDEFEAWAVASRHRPGGGATWPKSLRDYHTPYRAPGTRGEKAEHLIDAIRGAVSKDVKGGPIDERVKAFAEGIAELLNREGVEPPKPSLRWTPGRLWRDLDELCEGSTFVLREVFCDCLKGAELDTEEHWYKEVRPRIATALRPILGKLASDEAKEYVKYSPPSGGGGEGGNTSNSRLFTHMAGKEQVIVRLGSIASVKGQTHNATLVLETPRGQTRDVEKALVCIFGGEKKPTPANPDIYRAVTNVFVGATRPKHLLCIAARAEAVGQDLRAAAGAQGWDVIDLTAT